MKVINRTNYRLPLKLINYNYIGLGAEPVNNRNITSKWVREYSNPKAEELMKQVKATTDRRKKAELFVQIGGYELKDISIFKKIESWYYKNILKRILKDEVL